MDPASTPNANLSPQQFGLSGDLGSSGMPSVAGAGNMSMPASTGGSASCPSCGMGGSS